MINDSHRLNQNVPSDRRAPSRPGPQAAAARSAESRTHGPAASSPHGDRVDISFATGQPDGPQPVVMMPGPFGPMPANQRYLDRQAFIQEFLKG